MKEVYTLEKTNYFRIISIINEEGSLMLWCCLNDQLSGQDLDKVLSQARIKTKMQTALRQKFLTNEQFDLLYPGPVDKQKLDVTILCFLIRYLHPSVPYTDRVWSRPSGSDMSIPADVVRLKIKRNKYAHVNKRDLSVSEQDFKTECADLQSVLFRLAQNICGTVLTPHEITSRIQKKMVESFNKPVTHEMSTSTSSLEKIKTLQVTDKSKSNSTLQCVAENMCSNLKEQDSPSGCDFSGPYVTFCNNLINDQCGKQTILEDDISKNPSEQCGSVNESESCLDENLLKPDSQEKDSERNTSNDSSIREPVLFSYRLEAINNLTLSRRMIIVILITCFTVVVIVIVSLLLHYYL